MVRSEPGRLRRAAPGPICRDRWHRQRPQSTGAAIVGPHPHPVQTWQHTPEGAQSMIVEERLYTMVPGGVPRYLALWNQFGREAQIDCLGAPLGVYTCDVGDLNT